MYIPHTPISAPVVYLHRVHAAIAKQLVQAGSQPGPVPIGQFRPHLAGKDGRKRRQEERSAPPPPRGHSDVPIPPSPLALPA